jgi:hypothetical protein
LSNVKAVSGFDEAAGRDDFYEGSGKLDIHGLDLA